MHDATSKPLRMRYSYEVRCRAVDAMLAGMSPRDAAGSVGASRASGQHEHREAQVPQPQRQRTAQPVAGEHEPLHVGPALGGRRARARQLVPGEIDVVQKRQAEQGRRYRPREPVAAGDEADQAVQPAQLRRQRAPELVPRDVQHREPRQRAQLRRYPAGERVGPVGAGKSFLAQALGYSAVRSGHSVRFVAADQYFREMAQAASTTPQRRRSAPSSPPTC